MAEKSEITTRVTAGHNRVYDRLPARKRACLIQYNGDALGHRYFVDKPVVAVGRSPTNGIVILDVSVSRLHAKCYAANNTIDIEDSGSRNGTFINDQRIQTRTALHDGDMLRLGSILLKFFAYDNVENVIHDKIYRMATIDAGTRIFNKNYLLETLESEFTFSRVYGRPLSVIYYDLDFFKKVNDAHGHHCGDYVLCECAQVAKSCVRKDDILGRLGGEEFVVVLPNADGHTAAELAERIRKTIETHPFVFEGRSLTQTISSGVAQMKPEFKTFQDLLNDADRKLYLSKNSGRNRVTA